LFCTLETTHDLKLHRLAIKFDRSDFLRSVSIRCAKRRLLGASTYEVDTDCGDVAFGVCVIGEPQEQAGLSYTRVSDEEELEQVVVSEGSGRSVASSAATSSTLQSIATWFGDDCTLFPAKRSAHMLEYSPSTFWSCGYQRRRKADKANVPLWIHGERHLQKNRESRKDKRVREDDLG
jgi:hypothetical protein